MMMTAMTIDSSDRVVITTEAAAVNVTLTVPGKVSVPNDFIIQAYG